jgi:hypothetical protein
MTYFLAIGPFEDHGSAQAWAESHAADNYDMLDVNPCLPLRLDRSCTDQFERKYYLGCPTPE